MTLFNSEQPSLSSFVERPFGVSQFRSFDINAEIVNNSTTHFHVSLCAKQLQMARALHLEPFALTDS